MSIAGANTHVLMLCGEEGRRDMFRSLFEISGLHTVLKQDVESFLAYLSEQGVDLILLVQDSVQPPAEDVLAILKSAGSEHRDIPVIVVYPADTPPEVALQSLHLGAYDYLVEPFNEIELLTKITVLAKVKHAEDEFRQLAITDKLTGLYDRRYLFIRMNEELSRARRYSRPISCIVIDIDYFMSVNAQYGTDAGDQLLQMVADTLKSAKREIDVLARLDADSFVLVLYNTDATGSMVLASRLHNQLHDLVLPVAIGYQCKVSLGVSTVEAGPELTMHAQELQQRSELALQRAKKDGRDRIVVYSDEMAGDVVER